MIFLGIASVAAIGFFCWLLFTLAVFALPFFVGIAAGSWAYRHRRRLAGAILVGMVAAAVTLGGRAAPHHLRKADLAEARIASPSSHPPRRGLHATHGIVKHPCRRSLADHVLVIGASRSASRPLPGSRAWPPPAPPARTSRKPDVRIVMDEPGHESGHHPRQESGRLRGLESGSSFGPESDPRRALAKRQPS
jgi:hypothetical protein